MYALGDMFESEATAAGETATGGSVDPDTFFLEDSQVPESGTIIEGPAVIELFRSVTETYVTATTSDSCYANYRLGGAVNPGDVIRLPKGKRLCAAPGSSFLISGYKPN